jgi:hypothetical protein
VAKAAKRCSAGPAAPKSELAAAIAAKAAAALARISSRLCCPDQTVRKAVAAC